jgi:acetylornithine/succinyldiaminopimelate/putrescine aminotransferase
MESEDAPERAERAGARLAAGLGALPGVASVRGWGLLLAAELVPPLESANVATACLEAGLVVNNVTPTALRFEPPLLVTDDEVDAAVAIVADVLERLS